jgi:hypothetical protein
MIVFVRFTMPLRRPDAPCQSAGPESSKALHYEVHLDRKLERMLTMLVRLHELRAGRAQG